MDYLLSIFPDKNETKSQVKTKRKLSPRTASTRPPFCRATARVLFSDVNANVFQSAAVADTPHGCVVSPCQGDFGGKQSHQAAFSAD
ncbi:hypothetical protein KKG82_05225 [Patescibacteria group bacterium]|nr:hypothetical protein [Patescibacteria group bacterium]